ncbi:hypothetical protein FI178_01845 [Salmonella enterica subsp. enterica]|nr:hypothetical protein [Salmonella enterica subsp. enterica]
MANSLLETCNNWQIQRAEILARNPDMNLTIQKLDMMVEHSFRSAIEIAHRVDWDFREAERVAKEVAAAGIGVKGE